MHGAQREQFVDCDRHHAKEHRFWFRHRRVQRLCGRVFASLSPAISFALIGVIVDEFIGAERGIGRLIIESEARAEASGMMVAVIVLMLVGVALSAMIWRLQPICCAGGSIIWWGRAASRREIE